MATLWQCLEAVPGLVAVPSVWADGTVPAGFLRDTGRVAKSVPCECGCAHEVVTRADGRLVGVCRCEPWNCDDIPLTAAQARLLEFNRAKFGRAVCQAFGCEPKRPPARIPATWEAGVFSGLSVFLTVPHDAEGFRLAVSELAARQRQPFILLAPTAQFLDAEGKALLATVRAGFFDLETNLVLTASGALHARKRAGELFTPYLPDAPEAAPEEVALAALAIILKLDDGKSRAEPTVTRVFKHYCKEEMTADMMVTKFGWSKGTIINRLRDLEKATGLTKDQLRGLSAQFNAIEGQLTDSRARRIHRQSALDEPDDEGDE